MTTAAGGFQPRRPRRIISRRRNVAAWPSFSVPLSLGAALLLVAMLAGTGALSRRSRARRDDGDSAANTTEGASRRASVGGEVVWLGGESELTRQDGIPFSIDWLVIFWTRVEFNVKIEKDPWDGILSGFGIRFFDVKNNDRDTRYVLTDVANWDRAQGFANGKYPGEDRPRERFGPEFVQYKPTPWINVSYGNNHWPQAVKRNMLYNYTHLMTYPGNLAIFELKQIYPDEGWIPHSLESNIASEEDRPKFQTPADSRHNYDRNCYLFSYTWGYMMEDGKSSEPTAGLAKKPEALRYLTRMAVELLDKNSTSDIAEFRVIHKHSRICPYRSSRGAPIMCGYPQRISFMALGTEKDSSTIEWVDGSPCKTNFKAVRLVNLHGDLSDIKRGLKLSKLGIPVKDVG